MKIRISESLELRQLIEEDAAELFSLVDQNRDYLKEWLPWLNFTISEEDSRRFILLNRKLADEGKAAAFALFEEGQIVGVLSFNSFDLNNNLAVIGYWIAEKHQGRGIICRAVEALCDYGFKTVGLNRIEIRCAVENVKSRNIPKSLGFFEEGVLRQQEWLYDHYVDHVVYGLLERDWKMRKK